MALFDSSEGGTPARRSAWLPYAVAVLCAAMAVLVSERLGGPGSPLVLPVLLLGLVFSAAFGQTLPALLTAVLETAAAATLLFPFPWRSPLALEALAAFAATAAAILAMAMRYQRELRRVKDDLFILQEDHKVLAEQNEKLRVAADAADRRAQHAVGERDRFRDRMRASEDRLTLAAEASRFVIFDWDLNQNISFSGDLKYVFGTRSHLWSGYRSFMAAIVPEDREAVDRRLALSLAEQMSLDIEFRIQWPNAEIHWVSAKGTFTQEKDQPRRMIGVFQDITQRKASEEALVRQEKLAAAGRLAATIAHEINNPLAAVTNLLYIVKDDKTLSDAGRKYIELAQHELARAAEIAKQTLGFYRESNEPVRINLAELVEEVLSIYVRRMPSHIRLEKDLDPDLEIWALKGELRQVVSNLVSNAIYALEKGGTMSLRVQAERRDRRSGAMLEVGDNGPGIPAEYLERLFEPFFTTRKDVGTGLGLWVVQQIVEKHGGTIHVESNTEADRHGTRFSLFLPASTRQDQDQTVAA